MTDSVKPSEGSPTASRWVNSGPKEDMAWSTVATLLSGPITWALVGWLLDSWLGTGRVFTAVGLVIGFVTAFYIVWVRYGRDDAQGEQGS